jgi:hypothetical protein
MAELFSSFEEAWRYFLERRDPLEGFFHEFPDDEGSFLEGWLVEPSDEIKAAAGPIQEELSRFPWLFPVPDHFLHVWIGLREQIGDGWQQWNELGPLEVEYARPNCFHAAVVIEVAGPLRQLVKGTPNDLPTFLPHMTVAVTREPASPAPLREVLAPVRETVLGSEVVREVKRVRFPAARTTLFRPWSVEHLVSLG